MKEFCLASSHANQGIHRQWTNSAFLSITNEQIYEIGSRKIVIVIPAFNESESIGRVIDEAREALEGLNFTILVVEPLSQYFRP